MRRIMALAKNSPPVSPEELANANKLIGKVFRGECPADDPNHVHPHDCGYTVTGRICNCDCEWRAHDNTGMRYPERSDTTGGETDSPNEQAHLRVGEEKR